MRPTLLQLFSIIVNIRLSVVHSWSVQELLGRRTGDQTRDRVCFTQKTAGLALFWVKQWPVCAVATRSPPNISKQVWDVFFSVDVALNVSTLITSPCLKDRMATSCFVSFFLLLWPSVSTFSTFSVVYDSIIATKKTQLTPVEKTTLLSHRVHVNADESEEFNSTKGN